MAEYQIEFDPIGMTELETTVPTLEQPQPKYRANRKKFFLTYPKCDRSPEDLLAHLSSISEIHKYLIARELHKDGTYHLHAYVEFVKKQDFKNSRWADFDDHHPNDAGSVRNELAVTKYCTKDGNFISNFYKLDPYKLIYDEEKTYDEAIQLLKNDRPRDYTLYSDQIERTLKKVKYSRDSPRGKYQLNQFTRPPLVLDRAVLLCGPAGIGKTQYALAHFTKPLVVRHLDDLKKYTPEYDGLVFDDMSFNHLPSDTIIFLLDMELDSPIHCRHTNALIPAGTKRIFTHNDYNIFYPEKITPERKAAIDRRLEIVFVDKLK